MTWFHLVLIAGRFFFSGATLLILKDYVGFGRIRSDLVEFGWIWSDFDFGKFGQFSRIRSDLVGFGQIWSDSIGVAPGRGPSSLGSNQDNYCILFR